MGNRWLPPGSPKRDCQTGRVSQKSNGRSPTTWLSHYSNLTQALINTVHADVFTTDSAGLARSTAQPPAWENPDGKTEISKKRNQPLLRSGAWGTCCPAHLSPATPAEPAHLIPAIPAEPAQRSNGARSGCSRCVSAS